MQFQKPNSPFRLWPAASRRPQRDLGKPAGGQTCDLRAPPQPNVDDTSHLSVHLRVCAHTHFSVCLCMTRMLMSPSPPALHPGPGLPSTGPVPMT